MEAITHPEGKSYDDRLFSANFRGRLHNARFAWLHEQTRGLSGSVLELGCHNARSIAHLAFKPTHYLGFDADWEGGLDQAQRKYPQYEFVRSTEIPILDRRFDLALCLETIEHVNRAEVDDYLKLLALAAPLTLISFPNELGMMFVLKRIAHTILRNPREYSTREFFLQTFGQTQNVAQDNHKGFNFRWLLGRLEKYFIIEDLRGLPIRRFPDLSFTVAVRARSRLFPQDTAA